jgi:hypothetical protein
MKPECQEIALSFVCGKTPESGDYGSCASSLLIFSIAFHAATLVFFPTILFT